MNDEINADALYRRLGEQLATEPDNPDLLADLGGLLARQGRAREALGLLEPALARHPRHAGIRHNLAELLRNTGQTARAEALFVELLTLAPQFLPAYASLIGILTARLAVAGLPEAEHTALRQRLADLHNHRGIVLLEAGQVEAARAACEEALALWPEHPAAWSNLSNTVRIMGQPSEAEQHARRALALAPDSAAAWNNLGVALSELGRFDEAAAAYRETLARDPAQPEAGHNAGSGQLMMALYAETKSPEDVAALHRRWGSGFAPVPARPFTPHAPLRLGFVSGDFREHSVMYFVEGLLEHLDRGRFAVFCYANQRGEDEVTRRLCALRLQWHPVAGLSDAALCERIRADGIDVLIDLAGHTRDNRLAAMALRPAPVQATWIGYPATTGLPAIDFRLTDRVTDPAPEASAQHTEALAYLAPSQFNYRPRADAPAVGPLPALANGHVTFGSLNNLHKLNRRVVAAWSRILASVPGSRLLLHTKLLADRGVAGRVCGLFEAFGIEPRRLELLSRSPRHLELYGRIDIALDSFPYTGVTTSCEALWMGVPVVTLAGDRSWARSGASLLATAGLADWVAATKEDYVRLAVAAATDLPALAALRMGLREQLRASPLCDAPAFAAEFARCIEAMVASRAGGEAG